MAPIRVAQDALHAGDGGHLALRTLLVTGPERGRCEGTQGQGGPARRGAGQFGLVQTVRWHAGKAASDQVQERIGGAMWTDVRRHDGPGKPRAEHTKIVPVRGYCRIEVDERPVPFTR